MIMSFLSRKYLILLLVSILFISINILVNIDDSEDKLETRLDILSYTQFFSETERRVVNPHVYSYVLNVRKDIYTQDKVTLLAVVTSATDNFEKRLAIRQTWANSELFPSIEAVFITGLSKNDSINERLANESKIYGDIIQENFVDTYKNLTIKTVN